MPSSLLYGAIGAKLAGPFGSMLDSLLRLPWRIFRGIAGLSATIISTMGVMALALTIWCLIGLLIGLGLHACYQSLQSIRPRAQTR